MTYDAPTVDPDAIRERRVLVVVGGGAVASFELPRSGRLTIGRALECDVRIDDAAISRAHATLVVGETLSLLVESRSGRTRIDGRETAPGSTNALEPGQLIEIGKSRLVVRREREVAGGPTKGERAIDVAQRAIDLAAKSDLPVLVLGETGAGKKVAMEQIVARSRRSEGPLVRIDCAALDDDARTSRVEAARGGTVFLDEVASLPLALQSKLLGILESVDVRIIAATNVDLRGRVAEGTFREDLYFRLAGIVITIPPLRDRQSEIADLATALLAAESRRANVTPPALTDGALALLVSYRWPGNVRELRNALGQALHATTTAVIEPEHLILTPPAPALPPALAPAALAPAPAPPPGTPAFERARIIVAMDRANGNQKEAARLLGMTRRMLMYRLDTYDLPRPRKR